MQFSIFMGETLLNPGHAPYTEGVKFMISGQAQKLLLNREPISSRIITTVFKTSQGRIKVRIVQCYASPNNVDKSTKQERILQHATKLSLKTRRKGFDNHHRRSKCQDRLKQRRTSSSNGTTWTKDNE